MILPHRWFRAEEQECKTSLGYTTLVSKMKNVISAIVAVTLCAPTERNYTNILFLREMQG